MGAWWCSTFVISPPGDIRILCRVWAFLDLLSFLWSKMLWTSIRYSFRARGGGFVDINANKYDCKIKLSCLIPSVK